MKRYDIYKRLRAAVNACRGLLERDGGQPSHETAWRSLFDLALLRYCDAQLWQRPSQAALDGDADQLVDVLDRRRAELLAICPFIERAQYDEELEDGTARLSPATIHAVWQRLTESIPLEIWRTDHVLGWIYQYFHDTTAQKQHGKFYTPAAIVKYIISKTFDAQDTPAQHAISPSFSVLDLACGCGAFSLQAFDRFYAAYQHQGEYGPQEISRRILEQHLFLVDNDPWACRIAVIQLFMKARQRTPQGDIGRANVFCADALQRWESDHDHHLRALFARKYDMVVGNPPYIVVNQLREPDEHIRLYKTYHSAAYKINTFALFLERGLDLLKPGGVLGMIVPNTCLTQMYFEPLRQHILATSAIKHIMDAKRLFDTAFVENCIVILQREPDATARRENIALGHIHEAERHRTISIPQRHFERAPFNMFHVHIDTATYALLEKIAEGKPTLGEVCESHDGANPGNAKHKLLVTAPIDASCQKVLHGKHIGRYWIRWGGEYVRYRRDILNHSDNVRWGHYPSLETAKILTRQTADQIIGTFDDGQYYVTNSIHTTILQAGRNDFSLKYVLALLNSPLLSFYYRKLIAEAGQVFSQVKLINLRQLPLKPASMSVQASLAALVDSLLKECAAGRHSRRTRDIEDRIDACVYALYDLTAPEIALVKREMGIGEPR